MNSRILSFLSVLLFCFFLLPDVHAQLGKITLDLQKDKPEKFKEKKLRSERTGEKKFTLPRRFVQNTVSHYNYFFNANNKIDAVIERARLSSKDDYSKLIPFYGYTLDNTASQKSELDSVIYKATAGILLHDLRSEWVDNLYLLIGKAYYLRKDFDSAAMTFQFINYNLFPRKKKNENDQMIIGTNDNASNHALSVASKEDRSLIDKAFSRPPSRNDALVWQIRNLIEMQEYGEAAGLINTLKNDPLFPERLHPFLEEVQGYWFFKEEMYDSAIVHLENSLPNSIDMQDKARKEYLLAQLYEMNDDLETASDYYDKSIKHTTDPLMDIYANLNKAKMLKSKDPEEIDNSVLRLLRMARKDKFEPYRDIVYYSAADLALDRPDTIAAIAFYKKSTFYNEKNLPLKNKAFLNLAELSYQQKNYKEAFNFYDSLQITDTTLGDIAAIIARRNALAQVVKNINTIEREDSLQMIAGLSEADRESFIKKLSKKLKKERGIKDEETDVTNFNSNFINNANQQQNIFSNNEAKGEWYFYNNELKAKGLNEFKRLWGKRQNIDNWRIISGANPNAVSIASQQKNNFGDPLAPQAATGENEMITPEAPVQQDISEEGLLANIPLTKPLMDSSNSKIAVSLFALGKNYQNLLEDYSAAIEAYENSLKRFPDSLYNGELYLNLSYCYRKTGNLQQAEHYKNLLLNQFGKGQFAQYVLHPESFHPSDKDTVASNRYDQIYNLFIEGKFEEAIRQKNVADSLYGATYWNPQLLYLQSVYFIQKREDSAALKTLYEIMARYPNSPMKEKAGTMIDVLNKRDSIENYLTHLQIQRAPEDSQIVVYDDAKIVRQQKAPVSINQAVQEKTAIQPQKAEINPDKKVAPLVKNAVFTFDPNVTQYVMMVLTKVDPVYSSEARNAFTRYNNQSYYSQNIKIVKDTLDADRSLLIFTEFVSADQAIKYRDQLKKDAPAEISWLPAQKYAFYIISQPNLELLKENKNLDSYIQLLNQKYPGKF
jgi:tetratricopeptide (TPR) repeat protein